jgi:glycosyltransferase involved in cell wall biosynthesis
MPDMLAIFESHPVQYRAPVYQELQRLVPDRFHVFYATDVSLRGSRDAEFGNTLAWDEPLLDGYPNTVLKQERGEPLKDFRSLHGCGISKIFDAHRPKAILQTQYFYEYDFAVLIQAHIRRIPIWIRQETQDAAVPRSRSKEILRSTVYRLLYSQVQKGFYIGELNREHLRRHGVPPQHLIRAPYCTPDRFQNLSEAQFTQIRETCRTRIGIGRDQIVIGFFGKLIPKKNPELLMQAIPFLNEALKNKITLLYVGSGPMEAEMKQRSLELKKYGTQTVFTGFVNQSAIRDFYAATDILVLPSRYAGETWGLVVNEALQAGCAVVVSEAVGCAREFGGWERVRTIQVENAMALAQAVEELAVFPRQFNWAREGMKAYSTSAAAAALAGEIESEMNHT